MANLERGTHPNDDGAVVRVGHPTAPGPVRGAQSFVGILSSVWKRPGLTAIEICWRWVFGIPCVALIVWQAQKVLAAATDGTMDVGRLGLDRIFVNDPVGALAASPIGAASKVGGAIDFLLPGLERVGIWLVPALLVVWVVISSVGRTLVLRRMDPRLHARPGTLMGLQAVRIITLAAIFLVWFKTLGAIGRFAVTGPIALNQEPNLVLYCALVIVLSLGLFTAWGFVSWRLSVAPLLAMLRDLGFGASLRAAGRLGELRSKLVEINLVLAVVKIALVVLAMVFSATPLPFESVTTQEFLLWWWAGVTVIYLVWSDFFHVARLVGYLELWRVYDVEK